MDRVVFGVFPLGQKILKLLVRALRSVIFAAPAGSHQIFQIGQDGLIEKPDKV